MNTDEAIGRRVGTLMAKQGMTQAAMAARIGITQAAISRKLSGERPWYAGELSTAARVLGVTVGDLFGESRWPRRQGSAGAAPARARVGGALVFSG